MAATGSKPYSTYQSLYQQRWHQLHDPHVRDLAWLLDSPDLLDPLAPQWEGMIATLSGLFSDESRDWLLMLDRQPQALHAWLDLQPYTRLGRYAEKLMAFYLRHQGILYGHGIQVRSATQQTLGEFDFLLRTNIGLVHWEFATKFYLLESSGIGQHADYFVGPNLADTLGAKMHKILSRQLSLAQHPAAREQLPEPVSAAQALVKGWLFYHEDDPLPAASLGVSSSHCHGFWCALQEMDRLQASHFAILPRLQWLAPAKMELRQTVALQELHDLLAARFRHDTMPVLVALLAVQDEHAVEVDRGFIVPDDWQTRAGQRIRQAGPAERSP